MYNVVGRQWNKFLLSLIGAINRHSLSIFFSFLFLKLISQNDAACHIMKKSQSIFWKLGKIANKKDEHSLLPG